MALRKARDADSETARIRMNAATVELLDERDQFSRLLYGSQLSIALGVVATMVSMVFGVPLGLFAGYRPGLASEVIMRGLDVMMSFPPLSSHRPSSISPA